MTIIKKAILRINQPTLKKKKKKKEEDRLSSFTEI